jgi:hypothetical protein
MTLVPTCMEAAPCPVVAILLRSVAMVESSLSTSTIPTKSEEQARPHQRLRLPLPPHRRHRSPVLLALLVNLRPSPCPLQHRRLSALPFLPTRLPRLPPVRLRHLFKGPLPRRPARALPQALRLPTHLLVSTLFPYIRNTC